MIKRWFVRKFSNWVKDEAIEHCIIEDQCENCPWHSRETGLCNATRVRNVLREVEKRL